MLTKNNANTILTLGLGCSSGVANVLSTHEIQGSIPNTKTQNIKYHYGRNVYKQSNF